MEGIRPAGGEAWTRTANERLVQLVKGKEVEVKVLRPSEHAESSRGSLPTYIASVCLV